MDILKIDETKILKTFAVENNFWKNNDIWI